MIRESEGIIQYGPGKVALLRIDDKIVEYFRDQIPKEILGDSPRAKAHIVWVRLDKEPVRHTGEWGKHEGKVIKFTYEPIIDMDESHISLRAWSPPLTIFRKELGLPNYRKGYYPFQIVIANRKFTA